jgi:hypothetical protein
LHSLPRAIFILASTKEYTSCQRYKAINTFNLNIEIWR